MCASAFAKTFAGGLHVRVIRAKNPKDEAKLKALQDEQEKIVKRLAELLALTERDAEAALEPAVGPNLARVAAGLKFAKKPQ
jgi:hypothetical protein